MTKTLKRLLECAFLVTACCAASASAASRPNLILIFADDMGYADAGCYGGRLAPTPNIDALAAAGVRFTDAYVTAPVCAPSRCGILTGAYGARFGMQWNEDQHPGDLRYRIPEAHKLLPETLAAAGYATGHVGKWNVSRPVSNAFQEASCVMDWKGHYFADDEDLFVGVDGHGGKDVNGDEPHGWGPDRPGAAYLTDTLTDRAVSFIRSHAPSSGDGKPFFLYLAYNAVHSPWQAKRSEAPAFASLSSEPLRLYAAMLASLDANIGRVLRQLRESGVEGDTLVAFTSDNGPALGSDRIKGWKSEWPKEALMGSAAPLRGHKGQFFEGGIREPFILRWPGRLKAGTVYRRPSSTMDLYATFCAAAGAPVPAGTNLDGVNLLPYLDGAARGSPHERLFWLADGRGAMRRNDWKLLVSAEKPNLQLYNLAEDAGETHDRASERADLRDALHAEWLAWCGTLPPRANPPPKKLRDAVTGLFAPKTMTAPDGQTFTAFTVTDDAGTAHLIYFRQIKDKLPGGKWSGLNGKRVRVTGLRKQTAHSSVYDTVNTIDVLP